MYYQLTFIIIFTCAMITEEAIFISKFESCENSIIKTFAVIKTVSDSYQIFTGNYTSPIVNGDNLRAKLKGYIQVANKWMPLFVLEEEKGLCALLEKYIGPMFADVLRAGGMMPSCPIPAGTHLWKNYRPNFDQMKLQLPNGQIKINAEGTEKKTRRSVLCIDVVVSNK